MEPSVDMLINFMFKDDVADWQSGFYSASGVAKPSLRAFTLPFAEVRRSGSRTTVWGQIRPRSGSQPYRLQVKRPVERKMGVGRPAHGTRATARSPVS